MQIPNCFELDTNGIGLRSMSEKDIKLPYTGTLPQQMSSVSSAYVYLNVQLTQGARLILVVQDGSRTIKHPLKASTEEIVALLDRFFKQTDNTTGLTQYWLGLWQAHYIEWRRIATGPKQLLTIISTLSEQDRKFLQDHMMDAAAED